VIQDKPTLFAGKVYALLCREYLKGRDWCQTELEKKITSIEWKSAAKDVHRFVRFNQQPSLDFWCKDLFAAQLLKME